jgi:hypothetical protein
MLLAILLNLLSAVVLVGGWAVAVWTLHRRLGPPYLAQEERRPSGTATLPGSDRLREAVLSGQRAA